MRAKNGVVALETRSPPPRLRKADIPVVHAQGASRSKVHQLLEALKARAGGRHAVVLRGYPDPDALASAWAHVRLAASVGIACDIVHLSLVSRAENRAMVNLLGIPIVRITDPKEFDRYSVISLVDANAIELPRPVGLPCVSVVDHHSVLGKVAADFVDIRADVGATSTIYTEYLLDAPVRILETGRLGARLATALAYGIRSDSDDLLRASEPDLIACGKLCDRLDTDILALLSRHAIPVSAMQVLRRALDALQIEGTWAFAGASYVRPQDRDGIGQAADFLLRQEGIHTVLVFGLIDGWVDGSLRTVDPALDPAVWLREAFGLNPMGLPYGGGRKGKGGFQIPLGPIANCPDRDAIWWVVKETVESTIRRCIGAPVLTEIPPTQAR